MNSGRPTWGTPHLNVYRYRRTALRERSILHTRPPDEHQSIPSRLLSMVPKSGVSRRVLCREKFGKRKDFWLSQ